MNCLLYQLRFDTPVHFGQPDSALSLYDSDDHFRADTLFSALCHTALQLHGEEGLNRLVELVRAGGLRFSDSMPWTGETLWLPKPCFAARTDRELPADKRKAVKKLAWVPADRMEEYCRAMQTGELFSCEAIPFGVHLETNKAAITDGADTVPYPVGLFHFRENCGLYFLAVLEDSRDSRWLTELVEVLGLSGIGGKTTAGYGKFTLQKVHDLTEGDHPLRKGLTDREDSALLLLTTSLPRDEELDRALEGAGFQLVRRAGFVASDRHGQSPSRKQTQYFLGAGAVLRHSFAGDLYEVGPRMHHPVYRYSKPLFLGVSL